MKKNKIVVACNAFLLAFFFFFLIYMGCPGQLTRTTTIPHGPLNILQAQEQVRHRGGDRRAHRGSNPGRGRNKSHDWSQQLDPQVHFLACFCMAGFSVRNCWPFTWKKKTKLRSFFFSSRSSFFFFLQLTLYLLFFSSFFFHFSEIVVGFAIVILKK